MKEYIKLGRDLVTCPHFTESDSEVTSPSLLQTSIFVFRDTFSSILFLTKTSFLQAVSGCTTTMLSRSILDSLIEANWCHNQTGMKNSRTKIFSMNITNWRMGTTAFRLDVPCHIYLNIFVMHYTKIWDSSDLKTAIHAHTTPTLYSQTLEPN